MTERLDRRQLLILLAGWAAAILVPGIILIGQSLTLAYVVWGLAFIGQLALFVKIMKITRATELWPWLFASVFPWVVNFETPGHAIWLVPLFIAVLGAVSAYLFRAAVIEDRMRHDGIAGIGTVIDVIEPRVANLVSTEGDVRRTLKLSIKRTDQAASYEASLRDRFQADEVPVVGDVLDVRIDPENPQRVIAVDEATDAAGAADADTDADTLEEPSSD